LTNHYNYYIIIEKGRGDNLYRIKKDLNLDFLNRGIASEKIGLHRNTIGMIMRGDLSIKKNTAYLITKMLYANAEIEDFFDIEAPIKKKNDNE